jgi:hypothetical protein
MAATVREVQEDFLPTLHKAQGIALDALKTLVEFIQFAAPARPAIRGPLVDRMPTLHEVVADTSDFAEKLIVNQRQFADEVITVMSPLLPGKAGKPDVSDSEVKQAAGKAGKPAAA